MIDGGGEGDGVERTSYVTYINITKHIDNM